MNNILGVMQDIKQQKITDNEFRIIMDSQMEIYVNNEDNALMDKLKRDSAIERSDNEKKLKKMRS